MLNPASWYCSGSRHPSHVALLIDGENGPASIAAPILTTAGKWGEVTIRRVYGDWTSSQMHPWKETITRYGMRAVHQHLPRKNAADIALTIDAVDLFHQGLRRFCVVSGDSDYVPLVLWLVEHGCLVVVIGQPGTPLALQRACSVFLFTDQINSPEQISKTFAPEPIASTSSAASLSTVKGTKNGSHSQKARRQSRRSLASPVSLQELLVKGYTQLAAKKMIHGSR
jgi:uncharacterized LabA/DUF88 family protein